MKTLFYQVRWTKKNEDVVNTICKKIECECNVSQVFGAPANVKEIWFGVKGKDIGYVERQMNS